MQTLLASPLVVLAAVALAALLVSEAVFAALEAFARRGVNDLRHEVIRRMRAPSRAVAPVIAVYLVLPLVPVAPGVAEVVRHVLLVLLILLGTGLVIHVVGVVEDVLEARYPLDMPDNLKARRVRTRMTLVRRMATTVTAVLATGFILTTFEPVRALGVSLFASAGIAGIVLGIAARPVLTNVLAGLQVAFTDPIRIDDVVVVEGHWGRIENIGMTYVTVRIWDDRRLILPLGHFIENPFENWTRERADLLGSVLLRVDYRVPIEELRAQAERIVAAVPEWDGRFWNLQVTEVGERTMEVRILATAADAQDAWNLRAAIRERVVRWIQAEHPEALPRLRMEVGPAADGLEAERMEDTGVGAA